MGAKIKWRDIMKTIVKKQQISPFRWLLFGILLALLSILLSFIFPLFLPWFTRDWGAFFRPAAILFLTGHSPYIVDGFYSPPWLLLLISPLAFLPAQLGCSIVFLLTLFSFAFVAYKLGATKWLILLFVITPHVLKIGLNGNVDWLVALGSLLPPQFGLFLVTVKPQLGLPVVLFWLWQVWSFGGFKKVFFTFAPLLVVTIFSFAFYGLWPLRFSNVASETWNIAPWPYMLPVGLALLISSIRKNKIHASFLSAPFLSPYMVVFSMPVVVLGLLPSKLEFIAGIIGLWLLQLITGYPF
jgi:hypothetical protein